MRDSSLPRKSKSHMQWGYRMQGNATVFFESIVIA